MAIPKRRPVRARTAILGAPMHQRHDASGSAWRRAGTAASGVSGYHLGKKDSTAIAMQNLDKFIFVWTIACLFVRPSQAVDGIYLSAFSKYDLKGRCFKAGRLAL
jgi:hypothetical protein